MNRQVPRSVATQTFPVWDTLYGAQSGYLGVFSAFRHPPRGCRRGAAHARPSGRLVRVQERFFAYPDEAVPAAEWCRLSSEAGREAFYCVHLLTRRRRLKECAAPVLALWAESDGEENLSGAPEPTAIVESSPGRRHLFWRLTRPLGGSDAERLNRRLAAAIGADPSGWDLSQMSRPPGTRNMKYADAPLVRLLGLDRGALYHPRELDLALPHVPDPTENTLAPTSLPAIVVGHSGAPVDLGRLSRRMRDLAALGNRGAGFPYRTRSHADFAVAVAMFGKGYSPEEVAAVLLDPSLGISEKALGEGPNTDNYVGRTVRAASLAALPADPGLAAHKNTESPTEYR